MTGGQNSLNSNHERRLTVTCRHIDKLLAEMESAMNVSSSKLAFPQYVPDLTADQQRGIEDYITRIRAQLLHVLDALGIDRPGADIPVSRSLHAHLTFIGIAAEEMKAQYMRGYGEIPAAGAMELNEVAGELQGLVQQLNEYLVRETPGNPGNSLAISDHKSSQRNQGSVERDLTNCEAPDRNRREIPEKDVDSGQNHAAERNKTAC